MHKGWGWRLLLGLFGGLCLFGSGIRAGEAPPLLLAQRYEGQVDPALYWVSEKYDGVRAYWDGQVLRFRSGNPVPAPAWFLAALPEHPLDGELWLGRGRFQELAGLVRREQPVDAEWRQVRYMLFELPGAPGGFTERLQALERLVAAAGLPWLQLAPQFRVAGHDALMQQLKTVLADGGEGLMLHLAEAPYLTGRSPVLLKVTPEREAEALVIAHVPGKGRFQGLLGALRVRSPEGREFRIGTGFSQEDRRQPPAPGSWVTYRYRELTRAGLPRFPRYLRPYQPL